MITSLEWLIVLELKISFTKNSTLVGKLALLITAIKDRINTCRSSEIPLFGICISFIQGRKRVL